MNSNSLRSQSGFTLLEIAIVLVIVSTLLVMGLKGISAQMTNAAYAETKGNLQVLEDSLVNYLLINRRLPCPDTNIPPDGTADITTCAGNFGVLPWNDLGLTQDAVLDGWDNYISYRVSNVSGAVPSTDWTIVQPLTNRFFDPTINNQGVIQVNDASGSQLGGLDAVVLVSHGRDGEGAYTIKGTRNALPPTGTSELFNTNGTNAFVERSYTDDLTATGGTYDDVILRLSPSDLLAPLIKDGALKSPSAEVRDQLEEIKSAVIGYAIANCDVPTSTQIAGLPIANDPWSQPLVYTRGTGGPMMLSPGPLSYVPPPPPIFTPTIPSGDAFSVTSSGPDRNPGTSADNITQSMLWDTLAGKVPADNCPGP